MSLKGDLNTRQEIHQAYEGSKYLPGNITTWSILLVVDTLVAAYLIITVFIKQNNKLDLLILIAIIVVIFIVLIINNGYFGLRNSGIFSSIFSILGLLHFKLKSKTKDVYIIKNLFCPTHVNNKRRKKKFWGELNEQSTFNWNVGITN